MFCLTLKMEVTALKGLSLLLKIGTQSCAICAGKSTDGSRWCLGSAVGNVVPNW